LTDYHDELGHPNMAVTRMTVKANNLALEKGEIRPCSNCAVAKTRQKNVPKKCLECLEISGEFPENEGV